MQEYEIIQLHNVNEIQQINGAGRSIQEIFLKIKINGLISQQEERSFILQVTFRVKGITYQYTNIFTRAIWMQTE